MAALTRLIFCGCLCLAASLLRAQGVLNLTGRAAAAKPDILFFAPRLTEAAGRYESIRYVSEAGTTLPTLTITPDYFAGNGPLFVLQAAGYRILPIRDIPWTTAINQLDEILRLRRKTRLEDGIEQPPICALLSEDVTPEELEATVSRFLGQDVLIIFAPCTDTLSTILCWHNVIWPDHVSRLPISPDNLIPTLSEIVGLPPPAEVGSVSILPLLTGCGYQRPTDMPRISDVEAEGTEIRVYRDLPENLPWVPEFQAMFPSERRFSPEVPPFGPKTFPGLDGDRRHDYGAYIRTVLTAADWTFPVGVSCVIRVEGQPVFSTFLSEKPRRWAFETHAPVLVELYLLLPAGFEPEQLPLWTPAETVSAVSL